jgi:hypothetical protein
VPHDPPLTPGTTFVYESHAPGGGERGEERITHDIKMNLGVACIVVRDTVSRHGEMAEDTEDGYAQDTKGNVWYFGEEAKELEGGELVSIDGSWIVGRDVAQPGIAKQELFAFGLGNVLEIDADGVRAELKEIITEPSRSGFAEKGHPGRGVGVELG